MHSALYSAKALQALEQLAIHETQIPALELMRRAGAAAWEVIQEAYPTARSLIVFCGPGNNGGDGFVVATLAQAAGLDVTVYQVGDSDKAIEAQQACLEWCQTGGEVLPFRNEPLSADLVVDALLGTGTRAPIGADFLKAVKAINQSRLPVIALDLPTGLEADTGNFVDVVRASHTITFIGMKWGLVCNRELDIVGQCHLDTLGIDESLFDKVAPLAHTLDHELLVRELKPRRLSGHKGDSGHLIIIGGGQTEYSGAVCLAGESALRAGAGLVSAIVAPASLGLMSRAPAELMCSGPENTEHLFERLSKATHLVLGPGLGQTKWSQSVFEVVLEQDIPMVVDADGLNLLAKAPQKRDNWILTPHPGEAARLLDVTIDKVQEDRLASACLLQEKYGGVVVLKGAGTVIVAEGRHFVNEGGFPVLATGGTGDVLAGLIGGLMAQHLEHLVCACLGVSVHANAASFEETLGERGMLASDLFLHIRALLNPSNRSS